MTRKLRSDIPIQDLAPQFNGAPDALASSNDHGRESTMKRGVNVLALVKGEERFVFLYDDQSAEKLLKTLGEYAADPELSLTWYDCAILCQRVRQQLRESHSSRDEARRSARLPMNEFGDAA